MQRCKSEKVQELKSAKVKSPKAGEEWCGAGGKWCGSYNFEHLSLLIHFRAFKPSYTFSWVGKVLPEAKFENKCTLFFEFFDLSDLYIFEHLSLHIHFRGWGGSSQKQNSKINALCFLNFLI